MAFNETYDLADFNSFADFIANAKDVLEGENCELLFKSDTTFTDRDNIGYEVDFNTNTGRISSGILSFDMHFEDEDKPRITIVPDRTRNTNILRWDSGTWNLRLDFNIYNADITDGVLSPSIATENSNYSNCLINGTSNKLILNLYGKDFPDGHAWEAVKIQLSSLPISESHPESYIDDEDDSYIYNPDVEPSDYSNPPNMYYMYSRLYSVNSDYGDKQQEYDRKVEFRVPDGIRICYYRDNESKSNVMLDIEPCEFKSREYVNGSWTAWSTMSDLSVYREHYFADIATDNYIEFNNRYYYSACNTNIPLASSEDDAYRYLEHEINDDEMYIQQKEHPNKSGDGINSQTDDLNECSVRAILSRLYTMSYSNLVILSNVIFNNNASEMEDLLKGLEMYGNNPIACIADLYYTPIALSDFIDVSVTNGVKFGSYLAEPTGLSVNQVNFNKGIKQLCSTFIHGQFGDWRDQELVTYQLYLPFCGMMQLDSSVFVNHTLTVKVTYDLRSHNMKYYIFADAKLYTTKECSLGVNFVIMGNDTSGKAIQNLNNLTGLARSVAQVGLSVGSPVNAVGLATGAGDLATSAVSSIVSMTKEAPTQMTGNSSPASACNDILYPFLLIKTQKHTYPAKLNQVYGMPCNVVNKIGNSKGFTVVESPELVGNMLAEEKEAITALLAKGVYL